MDSRTDNRKRRGNGLLEAALVTLVFLATLIGVFDLGQILFVHQTFVARLRSAARFGAVRSYDPVSIRNMVLYGQPTAPEGSTHGIFGLTADEVVVTHSGAGTSEDRVVVSITGYPYRLFSPWIGRAFTGCDIVASMSMETP